MEDDPDLLEFYSMILDINGWSVKEMTTNGHNAIELYRNFNSRPEIVILDIFLSGVSGIDIAKAILDMNPSQKILFISGHTKLLDEEPHLCHLPTLEKPFNISQLLSKLEEIRYINNHLEA